MDEKRIHTYTTISREDIFQQLTAICARSTPEPGRRQVPFTAVETLLCYGLFYLVDPHKYGGSNIHTVPPVVQTLAAFFRRTPGSVLSKMLNLDGSRQHCAQEEPLLFAQLASYPEQYHALYHSIVDSARTLTIDEQILPDFLSDVISTNQTDDLLGQDDVPASTTALLADAEHELQEVDQRFQLGELLTEKLVERKVRLAQHRFAVAVLTNCGRSCVFCGFEPRSLPSQSGLLRASHIKPWAASTGRERVDVRNGLAACPIHDAAFDHGYITVDDLYRIQRSQMLERSLRSDTQVALYFDQAMREDLLLPKHAHAPAPVFLAYHREKVFRK